MSTITQQQQDAITAFLKGRHIPAGIGSESEACSIAAINLALSGKLTDTIPDCMSAVIGKWIIRVQDVMPDEIRNSAEWRRLLPLAAGTGQDTEQEKARLALIMDWMWKIVLPTLQPFADEHGFGAAWRTMITQRTKAAAKAAAKAAEEAVAAAAAWAAAADAAAKAADEADEAAWVAAADAAAKAADEAAEAAWAAKAADEAADEAAGAAAWAAAWATFDPCALLERMVNA